MRRMKRRELGEKVSARGLLVVGACASVVSIAVACGGKVTWVEDGPANTGGTSSGTQSSGTKMTSSTTSKGTTVGPSQTSSTGVSQSACEKICAIPACGNGDPGCVNDCLSFYTAGCEFEADNYLNCIANNIDQNCALNTDVCNMFAQAYEQCTQQSGCVTSGCEGGDSFCKCSGTCFGNSVSATCKSTPMGAQCDCLQNGTLIGQCFDMFPNCSLDEGCCSQFFQPILD